MAIQFNIDDILRVNTSYAYEKLASLTGKNNPVLQAVGYLSVGTARVLATGTLSLPTGTYSIIQLVPQDQSNPTYNDGQGVTLYFPDDTTINNTFELSTAYLQDTLFALVQNTSGSSIAKLRLVRQTGYNSTLQVATVSLADATTALNSVVLGFTQEAITNNGTGTILVEGAIQGIDTSGFAQGADVYLSDTPGMVSTTPGTNSVSIGHVTTVSASAGAIFLRGLNNAGGGGGGAAGATGVQGTTGIQGGTGIQGSAGSTGIIGLQGGTGIQGLTGLVGNTGVGVQGTTGVEGTAGSSGSTGIQGLTGIGAGAGGTLQSDYTAGGAGGGAILLTAVGGPIALTNPAAAVQAALTVTQSEATATTASFTGGIGLTRPGAGANSEAFGLNATAAGSAATALGNGATSSGANSVAIGRNSVADATSVAIGQSATTSTSQQAIIIGRAASCDASSGDVTLIGTSAEAAFSLNSIAIGGFCFIDTNYATLVGQNGVIDAGCTRSTAVGNSVYTPSDTPDLVLIGGSAGASFNSDLTTSGQATAVGANTTAYSAGTTIIGAKSEAAGYRSTLLGWSCKDSNSGGTDFFGTAIGAHSWLTANNQLVAGSDDNSGISISDVYFGSGVSSTLPVDVTVHGTSGFEEAGITDPVSGPNLFAVNADDGDALPAGTYGVKYTFVNGVGETLPSPATTIVMSGTQFILSTGISVGASRAQSVNLYLEFPAGSGNYFLSKNYCMGSQEEIRTAPTATAAPVSNTTAATNVTGGDFTIAGGAGSSAAAVGGQVIIKTATAADGTVLANSTIWDKTNVVLAPNGALGTTDTDGFTYVPSCAGTPVGTPTTYTGAIPMVVDTTNDLLYFYYGGTWKSTALA